MKEKVKDFVHEVFDIDRSFSKTFVHLFTKPEAVASNRQAYMKPWQYALYVVSISCLFMWFIIHLLADPAKSQVLWDTPKRVLDLENGYLSFYENSQPIKRLVFGSASFYVAMLIFFFKKRESLLGTTLYLVGHSLFLQFLVQAFRVMILGGGFSDSGDVLTSVVIRFGYLTYAVGRVYHVKWIEVWKAIPVFIITFGLYAQPSTYAAYYLFYNVMNRGHKIFSLRSDVASYQDKRINHDPRFDAMINERRTVTTDSLVFKIESQAPAGEVAKLYVSCLSKKNLEKRWSAVVFEKIDRYSPDSTKTLLMFDDKKQNLLVAYRISNDSNATIRLVNLRIDSGVVNFSTTVNLRADDIRLNDIAIDSSNVYLCGSARNIFSNVDLGMILVIDKSSGKVKGEKFIGEESFTSMTSFEKIRLSGNQIIITLKHEYKKFVYFRTKEWFELDIEAKKPELAATRRRCRHEAGASQGIRKFWIVLCYL